MTYILPKDVTAPQPKLQNLHVLYDDGERSWAAAEFVWDGQPGCIGIRWNGNTDLPRGNPISNNHPVWLVVPDEFAKVVRAVAIALAEARGQIDSLLHSN